MIGMKKKPEKRISFDETNAEHIYEYLRMYWRDDEQRFGGCHECEQIGRRLERFIGPTSVRFVTRLVRKTRDVSTAPDGKMRTSAKRMIAKSQKSPTQLAKDASPKSRRGV